jgi:hypothetical protein
LCLLLLLFSGFEGRCAGLQHFQTGGWRWH